MRCLELHLLLKILYVLYIQKRRCLDFIDRQTLVKLLKCIIEIDRLILVIKYTCTFQKVGLLFMEKKVQRLK